MKRFVVLLVVLAVIGVPIYVYMQWNKTTKPTIEYGPRTEVGVLTSTGISLIRRGTHVLTMTGGVQFFVQSNVTNLDEFVGQRVRLEGRLEPNVTTEYLPLFVAMSVTSLDPQEGTEEWSVPALGIRLSAPNSWKATITSGVLMFEMPETTIPVLIVKRHGGIIPQGESTSVGSKPGVAVTSEDGLKKDVYVQGNSGAIVLTLTAPVSASGSVRSSFESILRTVRFSLPSSSAPTSSVSGGSGATICGGAAGILCPAGFYCDIQDAVTNVGTCRKP